MNPVTYPDHYEWVLWCDKCHSEHTLLCSVGRQSVMTGRDRFLQAHLQARGIDGNDMKYRCSVCLEARLYEDVKNHGRFRRKNT